MSMSIERATLYEKYRLPYADQAIPDLLDQMGKIKTVADIGAGTGQLSRLFAPHCDRVYTLEPDPSMCAIAKDALAQFPNITIIEASAEQTTLANNCVDLIVIGNAFHRFKSEACDELHRILNNNGWIVLISYLYTNKAFTDLLFSKLATVETFTKKSEKAWKKTPQQNLFGIAEINTKSYQQSTAVDWKNFWGAARAGIESPEKNETGFAQFKDINREVFDTFAVNQKLHLEYETHVSWSKKPL